jgi:hypothetical protein
MKKLRTKFQIEVRWMLSFVYQRENRRQKNPVQGPPDILRSIITSALGSALGRAIVATIAVLFAVFAPGALRTFETLTSPANPAKNVASYAPNSPMNLQARVELISPTSRVRSEIVQTPAPSPQEGPTQSEAVTVPVTQPTLIPAGGSDPNVLLGFQQSLLDWQKTAESMGLNLKTEGQSDTLTLTGFQPLPTQVYDWSKVISAPQTDEMKALLDPTRVSSQTGMVQSASFQMPPSAWSSGILNPNLIQPLPNVVTGDNAAPMTLPTGYQTFSATTGAAFPTLPTVLSPTVQ